MNIITNALKPIDGYLIKIYRNTVEGWYEFEIGLPANWVFSATKDIGCDVVIKSDVGNIIKIYPKNYDINADDLVEFVQLIIETNEKIFEKEMEFTETMNQMKGQLEQVAKKFYVELDELKDNSFKNLTKHNAANAINKEVPEKKSRKKTKDITVEPIENINNDKEE